MSNCKHSDIPIDPELKLNLNNNKITDKPIRQLIGSLLHLMLGSRPDICFALNYLNRFQDKNIEEIWTYLKRILGYLEGTIFMGLEYKMQETAHALICLSMPIGQIIYLTENRFRFLI